MKNIFTDNPSGLFYKSASNLQISKSHYTKGVQCPKALWLDKYKPDVLNKPDDAAEERLKTGKAIRRLAYKLFPKGKKVPYRKDHNAMAETTAFWITDNVKYIYDATFNYKGILITVDILKIENDEVEIYEVKNSTKLNTIYLHDSAIQYYVLNNLGFSIKSTNIIHIDSSYVRDAKLDVHGFFKIVDVTEKAEELQKEVPYRLNELGTYLLEADKEPEVKIGKQCKILNDCNGTQYCLGREDNLSESSIFNIFNLGSTKQLELSSKNIFHIEDIPENFSMTKNQKFTVDLYKSKVSFINKNQIVKFLDTINYPVYHLDFETFQQVVPEFQGVRPYQQIPFQYSLHIEEKDKELQHKEFLAKEGEDPRYTLAKKLTEDTPKDVTVLAYDMTFEKNVIKNLAEDFEDLREHLMSIHDNIKDLMTPFQKYWYVTPKMKGSYSIKNVLPALVPEMYGAYKNLKRIQNGTQAMNAFANLSKMPERKREKYRDSLLEYSKLNTLAMVEILNKLEELR